MLCGVVSGSLMALGILMGRDSADDKIEPVYETTHRFVSAFKKRFGETDCRALTGLDLSIPEQRKLMASLKVKEKNCAGYLEWALEELAPHLP